VGYFGGGAVEELSLDILYQKRQKERIMEETFEEAFRIEYGLPHKEK